MRRRRDRSGSPGRADATQFHHQPFRQLKKLVTPVPSSAHTGPARRQEPAQEKAEDEGLMAFWREMADVRRLGDRQRARVDGPPPASPAREVVSADAEALAELSELVSGNGHFDITDGDEHVEGIVAGCDPRLLRRLRSGEFAYQAHLDLHGLVTEEARIELDRFLMRAYHAGLRCVLVIHGRGRNSKDQIPVLKSRVVSWLARGQWLRLVLAFASARACDGGAGALYVLLRRDRKAKRPMRVLQGAKW
jgi:DNA-nicking Smr family endonuclease